jgi:hypothetical protein
MPRPGARRCGSRRAVILGNPFSRYPSLSAVRAEGIVGCYRRSTVTTVPPGLLRTYNRPTSLTLEDQSGPPCPKHLLRNFKKVYTNRKGTVKGAPLAPILWST